MVSGLRFWFLRDQQDKNCKSTATNEIIRLRELPIRNEDSKRRPVSDARTAATRPTRQTDQWQSRASSTTRAEGDPLHAQIRKIKGVGKAADSANDVVKEERTS
jgi:hypothetical protein